MLYNLRSCVINWQFKKVKTWNSDWTNVESRGRKLHLFVGSHGQNPAEATFRGNEDIKADSISSLRVLFIPKPKTPL